MAEMIPQRQRPLGISIISIITGLQGLGDIIVAIIAFAAGSAITGLIGAVAGVAGGVYLIIGILLLILAWGLWTLKGWAFWTTVVIEALGVIGGLLSLFSGRGLNWSGLIHLIVSVVVLVYLFADRNVREAFRT